MSETKTCRECGKAVDPVRSQERGLDDDVCSLECQTAAELKGDD